MSIKEQIRNKMIQATKSRDAIVQNVMKVLLGEIQTQESRTSKELNDDEVIKVMKKTLDGVNEMLVYRPFANDLMNEKAAIEALMPAALDFYDILNELENIKNQIVTAKSDGQAIGLAMKHLKGKGIIDGNIVKDIVKRYRNPTDFFEGVEE